MTKRNYRNKKCGSVGVTKEAGDDGARGVWLRLTRICWVLVKEPLIYCTIGRMAALCPRSTLTYLSDKPRVSLRDALPSIPLSQINQRFLKVTRYQPPDIGASLLTASSFR